MDNFFVGYSLQVLLYLLTLGLPCANSQPELRYLPLRKVSGTIPAAVLGQCEFYICLLVELLEVFVSPIADVLVE